MADLDRVRAVVAQMRLEEKVALTDIPAGRATHACPALKVPSLTLPASMAPFAMADVPFAALGAAFDTDLVRKTGEAVSLRAALDGAAFGGTVPVGSVRTPTQENNTFGEDAIAVSRNVAAFCGDAVVPFVADEMFCEGIDRQFDVRALYELYLKPYTDNRACLGGVIAPIGAVNGSLCAAKPFAGVYDKTRPVFVRGHELVDPIAAASGGAFLTLDGAGRDLAAVYGAVRDGKLFEKKLDAVLEPLLARCVDYNEFRKNQLPALTPPDYAAVTKRIAEQSTVLLKNDGTLPMQAFQVVSDRTIFVGLNGKPTPRMIKKAGKYVAGKNALLILYIDDEVSEAQKRLAAVICAHAHTTTAVLCCTHAVETDFLSEANAILYAPLFDYGTVEQIVTGALSPSGRLPFTWAKRSDYPSFIKRGNREAYAYESVYVGYRYFDAFQVAPAFPFGQGLSYLDVSVALGKPIVRDDGVHIPFTATNANDRAGEYALLAFARTDCETAFGIGRRLCAFGRICFAGAEEKKGELIADLHDLCVYDPAEGFVLPGGKYTFEIDGAQSNEIKLGKKCKMKGYGPSDVPTYYPSSAFQPLGVETEKMLGAKAFAAPGEHALRSAEKNERALCARVCKRYKIPRADRPRVYRQLRRLTQHALEKAAAEK